MSYPGNKTNHNPQNNPLPPGWISQWDPNHQRWYFVDTTTGQSTWNDPRVIMNAPPPYVPPVATYPTSSNTLNQNPYYIPGSSLNNGQHTIAPDVAPVSVVDPTQAIALELSQSVPSLMGPPDSNAPKEVMDAYKEYIRSVQDAQNAHTRAIRDAQLEHEREIRDADMQKNNEKMNMLGHSYSLIGSISGIFNAGTREYSRQQNYKHRLDNAKLDYNKRVEAAHQQLNDAVEQANRRYEDAK